MAKKRKPAPRHDGLTPERKQKFLAALKKTGCVADACRTIVMSRNAIYRTRRRQPDFDKLCRTALEMAAGELEVLAYDRAVNGVEEQVIRDGKVVQVRKKPSDSILRMILQGSDPGKYGRQGAVARKQIEDELRAKMEEELKADGWIKPWPFDVEAARERILRGLKAARKRWIEEEGAIETPSGRAVTPADAAWIYRQVQSGAIPLPDGG